MVRLQTITSGIASRMLAQNGIAAIWQLQVVAAIVHRTGNLTAAECILEIADAAERVLLQSEDCVASIRCRRE